MSFYDICECDFRGFWRFREHGIKLSNLVNIIFTIILLTPEVGYMHLLAAKGPTRRKYKSICVSPVNSVINSKLCYLQDAGCRLRIPNGAESREKNHPKTI